MTAEYSVCSSSALPQEDKLQTLLPHSAYTDEPVRAAAVSSVLPSPVFSAS